MSHGCGTKVSLDPGMYYEWKSQVRPIFPTVRTLKVHTSHPPYLEGGPSRLAIMGGLLCCLEGR